MKERNVTEKNNSRRAFLSVGLKALALAVPVAAVVLTGKQAEARPCRRCRRW
jgi:hypothetical protein